MNFTHSFAINEHHRGMPGCCRSGLFGVPLGMRHGARIARTFVAAMAQARFAAGAVGMRAPGACGVGGFGWMGRSRW